MSINWTSDIYSGLYNSKIASDTAFQPGGANGLPNSAIQGGIASIAVAGTNNAYTSAPTISVTDANSTGSGFAGTVRMKLASVAVNAAGTGYRPSDTITLTYGTAVSNATRSVLTVTHVKVVSATISAGGTGGTNGTQTVAGTTGTGTKFQASVTISGGAITAVGSISVAGDYTVAPTDPTQEPVTGASLTGAILNVVLGVLTVSITTAGIYTAVATTATQAATSGSGTGFTSQTQTFSVNDVVVTAPGSAYQGTLTATFSAGNATASAKPTNLESNDLILLAEIVRAWMAAANSRGELTHGVRVMRSMLDAVGGSGTGTPNWTTISAKSAKRGFAKIGKQTR